MSRFFCLPEEVTGRQIIISQKEEVHHIADVMRQAAGDKVAVFDGTGKEYYGVIKEVSRQKVVVDILKISESREPDIKICLACALPKKSKFDFIVQKATELGVDEIIPLVTERTVVKPDKNSYSVKIKRWQKICLEAAKQSGRQRVPEIKNILKFEEALIGAKNYDLALIPHLMGERKDLRKLSLSGVRSAIIFIGPEGDFTSEEISLALNSKFQPVSLGKNILKTDTAAIFSIGILACLLNKL